MAYDVVVNPKSIMDIQKAIDYYDEQQVGLGKKFEGTLNKYLLKLQKNPFFSIRYDKVHCLPIKKYPFMIHFTIDEKKKEVTIRALFHTSLNPDIWSKR